MTEAEVKAHVSDWLNSSEAPELVIPVPPESCDWTGNDNFDLNQAVPFPPYRYFERRYWKSPAGIVCVVAVEKGFNEVFAWGPPRRVS